ncbi:histidine decarboxylase isoform X2 [Eupeodes corollae]|uniref:histidine decarboxylase isoform X2 n=1 Tax=Eupeodes corollae TaxID=290404 RepID=UPI00249319A3|nr:histidine decarboxylase isoform X2 [Eupeodes corollae]
MDYKEYTKRGKQMVDYIADYLENIRDRRVYPDVKPGYMRNLLPESAPIDGENWDAIFNDVERVIMPGVTHWQSPHMHAYFPALNSFPSLLGDMLADAINCLGFTWASSPACTELEIIVMNWLGKMIGLPDDFLHLNNNSKGGGVIQTTASESTLVCLLAGRTRAIQSFHERSPGSQDAEINARLVAYCSDQSHSSVEKAALIGLVRMRYIESDENLSMRGGPLREAIEDDIREGLIPFWVCATLGTTGTCAFDNLDEVGLVCRDYNLWLHLDAAYAGSAFICPEYRSWLRGVERADSIAFNPSKWLMVHFDCTALWVKDSTAVHRTFNVEPLYLQHENSGLAIDYMHWQIPLSKRFRSLKLWFVLRSFGIKGLQKHIREGVRLAQKFEALVGADHRFEIPAKRHLGMVVFRIKGENEITERLLKRLNHRGNLHCVPASIKGKYVIRFTVTSSRTTLDDILNDWSEIRLVAGFVLDEMKIDIAATDRSTKVSLKETKEKSEAFGSSLLLANSPMSPKIVNGSFAALFDADDFLAKTYAGIRIAHQESPSMRRRVRGILMSGKQFSLDSHMDIVVQTCLDSSTTSSTTTTSSKTPNPINEDNEDGWEAYESLGTPPRTPPPMISPLIMTPSNSYNKIYYSTATAHPMNTTTLTTQTSHPLITLSPVGQCDVVRTPTKKPPNTLTLPTRNSYIIDNTVFMHNLETSMSFTRCYGISPDSTSHRCALVMASATPSPLITPSHNRMFFQKSSKSSSSSSGSLPSPPGVCRTNGGSKRKSVYLYSSDGRQNSVRTQFKQQEEIVYHGKRYLDPVTEPNPEDCAFVNDGFRGISMATQHHYRSNDFGCTMLPGISEAESPGAVDWEAVRSNFRGDRARIRRGSSFPKFRLRINDEHGNRIKSSFETSPTPSDGGTPMTPEKIVETTLTKWFSTDRGSEDKSEEDTIVSKDGWSIESPDDDNKENKEEKGDDGKVCRKCGHSSSNEQDNESSSSSS